MTEIISTKTAPAAIGPYNQAVKAGNVVFCSGQIGLVPETGELAQGLEAQVRQAFTNLTEVVSAAGGHVFRRGEVHAFCDRHDAVRPCERRHEGVREGPLPRHAAAWKSPRSPRVRFLKWKPLPLLGK